VREQNCEGPTGMEALINRIKRIQILAQYAALAETQRSRFRGLKAPSCKGRKALSPSKAEFA
jgi:hypothetical protein